MLKSYFWLTCLAATTSVVYSCGCGVERPVNSTNHTPSSRVRKGQDVPYGTGLFVVRVLGGIRDENNVLFHQLGTGSIISRYYILTAKHLFRYNRTWWYKDPKESAIGYGSVLLEELIYKRATKIIHHEYNDVAIVRVERPFSKFRRPITVACLPRAGQRISLPNRHVLFYGWGKRWPSQQDETKRLQVIDFILQDIPCEHGTVMADAYCQEQWRGTGPCAGDSGGPTILKINGRITVIGVLHGVIYTDTGKAGPDCKRSIDDALETRVVAVVQWIRDQIRKGPRK